MNNAGMPSLPRRRGHWGALAGALALAVALSGCAPDFDMMRRREADQLMADLARRNARVLADSEPLGLEQCVAIALENNLKVRVAEVEARLADIDRKIVFANFLPHVNAGVTHVGTAREQTRSAFGTQFSMADQAVTQTVIDSQMSVFNPELWFLYSAFQKNASITEILARRARQMIRLQVTALYFACLSQERAAMALEASGAHARTVRDEVEALWREGLVMGSDLEAARALVTAQEKALEHNARLQRQTRSELLEAMGLSPLGRIALADDSTSQTVALDLEELVYQAMLQRPELGVSDRVVAMHKDQVHMAIAAFLPKVFAFGDFTHSSDSFLTYANMWTYGISGVMTVFDGFSNYFEYQSAREQEQRSMIEREQACLTIMLEVIRARHQVDRAQDEREMAWDDLVVARRRLEEVHARWQEGLVPASDKSATVSAVAAAEANLAIADFRFQVAHATLRDVTGTPGKDAEDAEVE